MRESAVRGVGLGAVILYAALIMLVYTRQPQTLAQFSGTVSASVGAYRVDQQSFSEGLVLFHADRFVAARAAWQRADPAERDARTQFYIAYSYYREGWHRTHSDDRLFAEGLKAADKAVALDAQNLLNVDDMDLKIKTPRELQAELQAGLRQDASDFNPMRLFDTRK